MKGKDSFPVSESILNSSRSLNSLCPAMPYHIILNCFYYMTSERVQDSKIGYNTHTSVFRFNQDSLSGTPLEDFTKTDGNYNIAEMLKVFISTFTQQVHTIISRYSFSQIDCENYCPPGILSSRSHQVAGRCLKRNTIFFFPLISNG